MSAIPDPARAHHSPFLRRLRTAVIGDLEPTIKLSCQVAVLQAQGYRRGEIEAKTAASKVEMRDALARVKRIAPDLDLPDLTDPHG